MIIDTHHFETIANIFPYATDGLPSLRMCPNRKGMKRSGFMMLYLYKSFEQCSKPWLVDDYRGLYYSTFHILGIITIQERGIRFLTKLAPNQYIFDD